MDNKDGEAIDDFETHHIEVLKTARYFSYGNPNADSIWFLLHGYGMSAKSMLRTIKFLGKEKHLFIAPEGLSRYYRNGFSGSVVASWMTKEDRSYEIKNYVSYLEKLLLTLDSSKKSVNVLGFSQGVATASRWVSHSKNHFDKVVLWAGEPASDIEYSSNEHKIGALLYVVGKDDPYIEANQLAMIKDRFEVAQMKVQYITFDGKHELNEAILSQIL
jgi:predicted esterase